MFNTIDSILKDFHKKIAALDKIGEAHRNASNRAREQASKQQSIAAAQEAEAKRAAEIKQRLEALVN